MRFLKKDDTQGKNKNEIIPSKDANSGMNTLGNEVIEFSLKHFPYPLVNFHSDTLDYFYPKNNWMIFMIKNRF